MRVAVPQGYMVAEDASGGVVVTLCGSGGTWTIPMAAGNHQDDGTQKDKHDAGAKTCHFAGHSASATPPAPTEMSLPSVAVAAYDAVRAVAMAPPTVWANPPSTGPPILI